MLIEHTPSDTNNPIMNLTAYGIQGKRAHMEDFYDIGYQMKPADQLRPNEWPYEFFYFGIFDGHGGYEAAKYAKKNLLRHIIKQNDFWSNNDDNVMRAISSGFAETHSAMRKEMPKWSRTSKTLPSTAGTTASILFIKNGKYYTGHVGDSRIVIAQENSETHQWIAHQLTEDHKPESEKEIERIESAGGEVRDKTGVQRVVWKRPVLAKEMEQTLESNPDSPEYDKLVSLIPNYPIDESLVLCYQLIPFLAIARSLGDFWSINPYSGQYVVSPEPDVSCRPISPNDTSIILASDGLWNVMDAMKAVRFLQELEMIKYGSEKKSNTNEHFISDNYYDVAGKKSNDALSLVYFAYQIWERKRLRSDNITVVVARLYDLFSCFNKTTKTYPTRLSMQHQQQQKQLLDYNLASKPKLVQVYNAYSFMETIRLNSIPRFSVSAYNQEETDKNSKIESQLMLPPTIIEKDMDVVHPKNYTRLSKATCRVICSNEDFVSSDTFIRIKTVSDDPSDLQKSPTYLSKSGKQVRDSSAQVSDCLHDFGQPWNELEGEEIIDIQFDFDEPYTDIGLDNDEEVDELDKHVDDCDVEEVEEVTASVFEDGPENVDKLQEHKFNNKDVVKTTSSIPQLRCLLNYTPALRRSKRRIYLSLSENTKRKNQPITIPTSMSKNKRRKSQPVRTNVART